MDGQEQKLDSRPIVNRDEPIPIVAISSPSEEPPPTPSPAKQLGKREILKEKLQDAKHRHKAEDQPSIQDRLFST